MSTALDVLARGGRVVGDVDSLVAEVFGVLRHLGHSCRRPEFFDLVNVVGGQAEHESHGDPPPAQASRRGRDFARFLGESVAAHQRGTHA